METPAVMQYSGVQSQSVSLRPIILCGRTFFYGSSLVIASHTACVDVWLSHFTTAAFPCLPLAAPLTVTL